jgi:predicted AAA+ superfamily ATPase
MESNPSRMIKQLKALSSTKYVFIDEAQKVPELFDAVQYAIDEKMASFIITGSSARKLRRKGTNLLPGRVITFHMDPLSWNEFGWTSDSTIQSIGIDNINSIAEYSFNKSLIFGSLPGIVSMPDDHDRKDILKAYTHIYLEEEIRAEALSRKIGAFGRFLELAARESGTNPNMSKMSRVSGVSVPTVKEFYNILEDTLIVERLDPYSRNVRKRIVKSPRYYFFDIGVRNSLARVPFNDDLINVDRGRLFEHAVILEIIRRIRALNKDFKVCYWRTSGGAEVDCIIDTGMEPIPVEIKAGATISMSDLRGLRSFIQSYPEVKQAYVITTGRVPEQLSEKITAVPWQYL